MSYDCEAPVKFYVEGERIPVIDEGVTVYERKDGPLAISRRAEITFPIQFDGTTWTDKINAFSEDGETQVGEIRMKEFNKNGEPIPDSERLVMRGYVSAVGSRGNYNKGRVQLMGPYRLLTEIPVGQTLANFYIDTTPRVVQEKFNEGQNIFDDVDIEIYDPPKNVDPGGPQSENLIGGNKSFINTRDTLADVTEFFNDSFNFPLSFVPNEENSFTVTVHKSIGEKYNAVTEDDVSIINNNALYELRPFNKITVKGAPLGTVNTPLGDIQLDNENYVEATAKYPPLIERAKGEIGEVIESDRHKEKEVTNQAANQLKKRLDDVSGGTMDVLLNPELSVFDQIEAKPVCNKKVDGDVPTLTYEVERLAHTVAPHDPQQEPQVPSTELSVSMYIDPELVETEATVKPVQPTEGTENNPIESPPSENLNYGGRGL